VWVASLDDATVIRIDDATQCAEATLTPVRSVTGIAAGGGAVIELGRCRRVLRHPRRRGFRPLIEFSASPVGALVRSPATTTGGVVMAKKVVAYLRRHHIALLALFLALSGTAYAATLPRNSVGPAQLKRNAVNSSKVRDRSLLRRDFRAGQLPRGPQGPAGARGLTGPGGPAGPAGPAGRNAVTSLTLRDGAGVAVGAAPATATATVTCNAGEVAISGGGITANGNAELTDSFALQPAPDAPPNGWEVDYRNDQAAADTVFATVVCATP
jgi:hypothetical protein